MKSTLLEAETLAARMPRLIMQARKTASQLTLGLHGRKKAGVGEEFWQFRRFDPSEDMRKIDWRRSARDRHYSVRERELEVAQRFNLWPDLSLSMQFGEPQKADRAMLFTLILADLLNEGGEKIALAGLTPPFSSRRMMETMAHHITNYREKLHEMPSISKGEIILFTDGFGDFEALNKLVLNQKTHLVIINDEREETYPYSGRVLFEELETSLSFDAGRAESLKTGYLEKLALHREKLRALMKRAGGSIQFHTTDKPPAPFLLQLLTRLQHV